MNEARLESQSVSIRPSLREDLPAVQRISWLTWKATYGPFIPEQDMRSYHDEHYSLDALALTLRQAYLRGFMALVDGAACACMIMSLEAASGRCSISSLYVAPAFQNFGLGSGLMHEAERVKRGAAFDRIWLGVMKNNQKAIDWYCRFHFEQETPFTMGRTTVIHLIGYRILPPQGAGSSSA